MAMNTFSKLMLSDEEQVLVNNTALILTKRKIMDQVNLFMGIIHEHQQVVIDTEKTWLPATVVQSTAKIARGENYRELPYVLLDYPRCFDAVNIFAVRTLFWWGNFFSITLHLSGNYKERFQQKIVENIRSVEEELFVCIHENQWQHHFEADNYIQVNTLTQQDLQEIILKKDFVKLAVKFPLVPWVALPGLLDRSFLEIIKLLKD